MNFLIELTKRQIKLLIIICLIVIILYLINLLIHIFADFYTSIDYFKKINNLEWLTQDNNLKTSEYICENIRYKWHNWPSYGRCKMSTMRWKRNWVIPGKPCYALKVEY